LGTQYVHSNAVESNGAIGKQVSEIDTQDYVGSQCGTGTVTDGANLDHAGQNVYVELLNDGACTAIQTFNIWKDTGKLTFNGEAVPGANAGDWVSNLPQSSAMTHMPKRQPTSAAAEILRRGPDSCARATAP